MNEKQLDQYLEALKRKEWVYGVDSIDTRVFQRVDQIRALRGVEWWRGALQMAANPQFALLLLIVTVMVGTVTSVVAGDRDQGSTAVRVEDPLGFSLLSDTSTMECFHKCFIAGAHH
ncbi:MAG: hypothetical protein LR015_08135 [Verrucomicrobia bacterium]|nr:hypothetical protein [Verrucomicrobiota bacterium]